MTQEDAAIIGALLSLLARGQPLPEVGTEISGTDFRRFTDDEKPIQDFTALNIAARLEEKHLIAALSAVSAFRYKEYHG